MEGVGSLFRPEISLFSLTISRKRLPTPSLKRECFKLTQYLKWTTERLSMPDRIEIRDLLVRAIVGINDDERENRQDVVINITLHTDMHTPGGSDDISDAVNYRTLTKRVLALVEGSRYFLVEKMATEIAKLCLSDDRIERVIVSVEKPSALRFARSVGVTIERSQSDV